MEKQKMYSSNLVEKNIEQLAKIFPNCITESTDTNGTLKKSVDFDLLRQELSDSMIEGPEERYNLNWPGKRKALLNSNSPVTKTLRPCRTESVGFDTTQNLFIEGDNLDTLKILQETYLGKVKLIYIDPPYNTGNDFIYKDDFAESVDGYLIKSLQKDVNGHRLVANTESNGRFHSDWLTMMYSRLKLARNLLKDDGVIFISIDDNEMHNLRKLCDEVFGENNCLGIIANINNPKGRSDDKFIARAHEYLAVYSKDFNSAILYGFEPDEKITKRYNKVDEINKQFREIDLRKTGDADKRSDRPDMFFYFYYEKDTNSLRVSKDRSIVKGEIEIIPVKDDGSEGRWRWGYETALKKIDTVYAKFMPTRKIWGIFEKDYLEGRPPVKSTSSWTFKDVNSERGSEQFIDLGFDKEVFQRPKPVGTLKRVIEVGTLPNEKSLILDFFAGSAGIAQAVFELNVQGKRDLKFITVQLPEVCGEESQAYKEGYKNIAEISKERIRCAGKKTMDENPTKASNFDKGFRVLKVDSSNMTDVYYTPDNLEQGFLPQITDNVKDDRAEEDLLFQVLLDWGVDLSLPIMKESISDNEVFFVDGNSLIACFVKNGEITEDFCKELAKREPLRVVFRDAGFKDDNAKINVEQIFKLTSPHTDIKTI
jgi:adenine-specific DNA-methyltransferase